MILVLLANALTAFMLVASKPLLAYLDPIIITNIRLLGASLLLLLYYLFANLPPHRLSRSYLIALFILGVFNGYGVTLFGLLGLNYVPAVHASLWSNCTPFVVALINYMVYRTKLSYTKILAILLGWLGFIPLLWGVPPYSLSHYLCGVGCFLAAAIMTAISAVMFEKNSSVNQYPSSLTNGLIMAIGGLIGFIHYMAFFSTQSLPALTTQQFTLLGFLIPATLFSAISYFYFVKKFGSLVVTFAGFSLPLFSTLFEYAWKGTTQITPSLALSAAIITFALFLFTRE